MISEERKMMNKEDIALIEKELNIKLPESYIRAAIEAKMASIAQSTRFYDDPQKLIRMNLQRRKKGLHGQAWQDNHFVFGYYSDKEAYYFIDINIEDGFVYYADRTKTWRYSPDNISYNESPHYNIERYIYIMCLLDDMVKNRANQPPPPKLTPEENREKIAKFLADLKNKKE